MGSLGSVRPFVRRYSVFPPLPPSYSLFTDPFSTAGHRAHTGTVVCICPHRSNTASVLFLSSRTRLLLSGERALDSALDLTHLLFGRTAGGRNGSKTVGGRERIKEQLDTISHSWTTAGWTLCLRPPFQPPSTGVILKATKLFNAINARRGQTRGFPPPLCAQVLSSLILHLPQGGISRLPSSLTAS